MDGPTRGHAVRGRGLAVAITLLLAACTSTSDGPGSGPTAASPATSTVPSGTPLKVAWLNQGDTSADGDVWTAAQLRAQRSVQRALGARVKTKFVEFVQPGTDARRTIDRLVDDGYRLIFATSFPLSADLLAASRRHPDVHFEQARGIEQTANLGTYGGADEEPIYLAGMAAGADTRSGRIGFVGTVPEPETIRHIDAFTLGVRRSSPSATVEVAWTNSPWAPDAETAAAERLLASGNDVLATGATSMATGVVARAAGVGWVGHDADHSKEFADVWLTGAVPDWSRFYEAQVRAQLAGRWKPEAYYGSLADGYTSLAPLGSRVSPATRASIAAAQADIVAGRLDVFAGPLTDTDGRERAPAGGALSQQERFTIDWLVQGVVEEAESR